MSTPNLKRSPTSDGANRAKKVRKNVKTENIVPMSQVVEETPTYEADLNNFLLTHAFNEDDGTLTRVENSDNNEHIPENAQRGNKGPLYSEKIYFINKSHTKWVAVGLCSEMFFEPVVRIMGKGQCITLKEVDWKNILSYKSTITSSFGSRAPSQLVLCGINIACEWIENARKILKLERNAESVYLAYDSLHELWKVGDVINTRFEILKNLEYKTYYDEVIKTVSAMAGDMKQNVVAVMNGTCCEQTCITKELLLYGVDKILWDIDLHNLFNK